MQRLGRRETPGLTTSLSGKGEGSSHALFEASSGSESEEACHLGHIDDLCILAHCISTLYEQVCNLHPPGEAGLADLGSACGVDKIPC